LLANEPDVLRELIKYFRAKVATFRYFQDDEGRAIYQLTIKALQELLTHGKYNR
jgi:hypothetical protein